jgi:hypothetical protein
MKKTSKFKIKLTDTEKSRMLLLGTIHVSKMDIKQPSTLCSPTLSPVNEQRLAVVQNGKVT